MWFFTADEHYGHKNIIAYCKRPFKTVEEMNEILIDNHNAVVGRKDITVHAGDFCFPRREQYVRYLNGNHIFIRGNHDHKGDKFYGEIYEKTIEHQKIVVCHYAMRTWNGSHRGAWNLHGHTHGTLEGDGKQWDVGVDVNNFTPVSFEQLKERFEDTPKNKNYFYELKGIQERGLG